MDEIWHAYASMRSLTTVKISSLNYNRNMSKKKFKVQRSEILILICNLTFFMIFFKNARKYENLRLQKFLQVLLKHIDGFFSKIGWSFWYHIDKRWWKITFLNPCYSTRLILLTSLILSFFFEGSTGSWSPPVFRGVTWDVGGCNRLF